MNGAAGENVKANVVEDIDNDSKSLSNKLQCDDSVLWTDWPDETIWQIRTGEVRGLLNQS